METCSTCGKRAERTIYIPEVAGWYDPRIALPRPDLGDRRLGGSPSRRVCYECRHEEARQHWELRKKFAYEEVTTHGKPHSSKAELRSFLSRFHRDGVIKKSEMKLWWREMELCLKEAYATTRRADFKPGWFFEAPPPGRGLWARLSGFFRR